MLLPNDNNLKDIYFIAYKVSICTSQINKQRTMPLIGHFFEYILASGKNLAVLADGKVACTDKPRSSS